ncbi:MAG: hypothetical protein QHH15_02605 [Candidatus Thermoplasmatota archaeon]|jgi:hypothetical protein|nr:hypothetical protein [Candidatus Thermoplasmatota archaeon]
MFKIKISSQQARDDTNIITLEILSRAIANKTGIDIQEARKNAGFVLDVFGYNDRIIDNILDYEDRQLFYFLEEEGMLATDHEDTILYDGREWRTHYWILKKKTILKYAKDKNSCLKNVFSDKPVWDISNLGIYDSLSEDAWTTRKKRCI